MQVVATGHSNGQFSGFTFALQKFCIACYFKKYKQPSPQQDIFTDSKGDKQTNNQEIKDDSYKTHRRSFGGFCKVSYRRKINIQTKVKLM